MQNYGTILENLKQRETTLKISNFKQWELNFKHAKSGTIDFLIFL